MEKIQEIGSIAWEFRMNLTLIQLLKKPSAFIPIVTSLVAFGMVLVHTLMFGVVHETDEGTVAHVFQLLVIAQLPFVVFFTINWISQATKNTLNILAMQVAAALIAILAVGFLT